MELLILGKEAFVVKVSYGGLGRGEVSLLGKKTWLIAARIDPRRSSSGSTGSSTRSSREVEVDGVREKAAKGLC